MGDHTRKPGSPGDILEHHGVKGMKWGFRDSEVPVDNQGRITAAGHNTKIKMYMAETAKEKPLTGKAAEAALAANKKKSLDKLEDASGPFGPQGSRSSIGTISKAPEQKKGLSSGQKKALIYGGLTVGAVGALVISSKLNQKKMLAMAGTEIPKAVFDKNVLHSQIKSWALTGCIQPSSYARPGFELPAGHEFFRLSRAAETGFKEATYATHSVDDYQRYLTNFTNEIGTSGLHKISWKSTAPIKVPVLHEVLDEMHDVLKREGLNPDEKTTLSAYKALSGSGWTSERGSKLLNGLKGKGFGAIVDELDAGVIGESPLVFFAHDNVTEKTVQKLTSNEVVSSSQHVIELLNRKV